MLENVGRKVTLIVALVLASCLFLTLKDPPFQMGLDLEGGTRLTYSVDFEEAYANGTVDRSENQVDVLNQLIQIIRNRIDPDGLREPIIRAVGTDHIVIELPGSLGVPSKEAAGALASPVSETGAELELVDATEFPESGIVKIGEERIRYEEKVGNVLRVAPEGRHVNRSLLQAHAAGATVELEKDDAFRAAIESLGELTFQIRATEGDMPSDTDYQQERRKLEDWAGSYPNSPVSAFNRLAPEDGGPHPEIEWYPQHPSTPEMELMEEWEIAVPVYRPATEAERFTGSALSRVYPTRDDYGLPAVGFEIQPSRRSDFGDFTGSNKGKRMAIILNGEVHSAPNLEEKLVSGGRIQGQFSDEDVKNLMTVLRSGSLKIKPKIENDERVGATLGDEYVRRGEYSGLLAVVLVLIFFAFYYRRLGVLGSVSLLLSFLMLMGALSFGEATLTLPGIAGIILTIGMAVDANILIFDRIREERDKGRNVKQAAREGFEKAMPAILDSNITTFLTALILRGVGTGPVRGFAVTLMWGIVTSVFAALVITRVLVHFSLAKGQKEYRVGTWFVTASYRFMHKGKLALMGSAVVIVTGLAFFSMQAPGDKFGIDFVGGAEAQIRTAKPETVDSVRARVASIPDIGESADVKAVLNSAEGDGYRLFRTTFKTDSVEGDYRQKLLTGLEGFLLEDAIQVEVQGDQEASRAEVRLLFELPHPTADIAAILSGVGLQDPRVESVDQPTEYLASAGVAFGRDATEVLVQIQEAFNGQSDSAGKPFEFADGLPSYSSVSAQVVGQLRDKALLAIAISLFVIVLYIRVRFAEYSYGFAAVAALVHDVLITLTVLTFANASGFLNGEINLPMIAAFLTIIGYSLNDTIIIFDRVRENIPRTKKPFAEVLDLSVNQTLSRTVMTSFTTFLAVSVLFAFNFGTGNVLESFSFAMMVGVITGTYSTIFIANPVLLLLEKRTGRIGPDGVLIAPTAKPQRRSKDDVQAARV